MAHLASGVCLDSSVGEGGKAFSLGHSCKWHWAVLSATATQLVLGNGLEKYEREVPACLVNVVTFDKTAFVRCGGAAFKQGALQGRAVLRLRACSQLFPQRADGDLHPGWTEPRASLGSSSALLPHLLLFKYIFYFIFYSFPKSA